MRGREGGGEGPGGGQRFGEVVYGARKVQVANGDDARAGCIQGLRGVYCAPTCKAMCTGDLICILQPSQYLKLNWPKISLVNLHAGFCVEDVDVHQTGCMVSAGRGAVKGSGHRARTQALVGLEGTLLHRYACHSENPGMHGPCIHGHLRGQQDVL